MLSTENMESILHILICGLSIGITSGLNNGLARTPPMGWMSWERFRCVTDCKNFPDSCVNEKLYMEIADKMVELKLKDLGYVYVSIDDCWPAKKRDPTTGKLVPDPERFPSGIKALADYMHARGLKLGIYEDFGIETCAHYPGSEFYMQLDAQTFAEWNVDMLKFDGCYGNPHDMAQGYPIMQMYMNKTGHHMLFACEWPLHARGAGLKPDYAAIRKTCNMWRNYADVDDSWESIKSIILFYGNNDQNFRAYTGPGGWADPDQLVIGNFGLSHYQEKAQFGMWAMFSAPLYMSVDLRTIDPKSLAILKNKDVIAINQDPLGVQAKRLYAIPKPLSAWIKPLSDGSSALAIFNEGTGGRPRRLTMALTDYTLRNPNGYNITDVFEGKPIGTYKPTSKFNIDVDPTSILLMKVVPL